MIKEKIKKNTLFRLAILSFGLSLCSTFQLTNLSSIFRFLGASNHSLPLLWLAPPLTGLLVQPIVGQMSDNTITKFGKRRPYILGWGALACLSLFIAAFFNSLIAIIILTLTIDCGLNGSTESLRCLTGDLTDHNESVRSKAFALQAFFAGIGGGAGTLLPYFLNKVLNYYHVDLRFHIGELPFNLKLSFIIISFILAIALLVVLRIKEKKLQHESLLKKRVSFLKGLTKIFPDLYTNMRKMSSGFKQLCFIHALNWIGVFLFWLYFTATLANNFYGLPVTAKASANIAFATQLQNASLDSSFYFTIYQYVSIVYAAILFFFSSRIKIRLLHAMSLLIGGSCIGLICFERSTISLIGSMVGVGIMWGSMLVLPYTLAMKYIPKAKLGIYFGIFNMSITIPQIFCGLILAPLFNSVLHYYNGYILLLAGFFICMSGILWIKQEHTRYKFRRFGSEEISQAKGVF